jgi:hypothetical protein
VSVEPSQPPKEVAFFVFVASDYPFLDVFWTMIIFFLWVIWIWFLIAILSDVFGGGSKALWCFFIIFLPFLGALTYVLVNGQGMAQRNVKEAQTARSQTDEYIRSVAGGPAGEIEKAKQLLDSGAISADEYAALKAKALAGGTA